MSVQPLVSNPDGTYAAVCVETGHTGNLAPASITFGTLNGTLTPQMIYIPCPDLCGKTVSVHPIADGAVPAAIQELLARTIARAGCPCGVVKAGASLLVAVSHARLEAQRVGGPTAWRAGPIQ